MFRHRFFGIALHAGVEGGVDLQTVLVDIVFVTVGFLVLLTKTIEGIILPIPTVNLVLLFVPIEIIALLGFFSRQDPTQVLAEIRCYTLLMIDRTVM